ncbi:uncharacterized protein METZ01_LOCUS287792 [marine metagenome]|jgi:uncharacterized membrane protein (UPF0136 family)|uniref:MotA/TolQ/ExbB proton channel domain-containing protein n=1 Tax=marine metagenome TaxID=408172 RepID=A0A382LDR1_9ZZZZ|tara:strand:- start:109 stop:489 length:381 start_codon:yes stop_codon:yes gene_type:complete
MTEYQVLNLMQVGFIQNAMYFVGMVLMTWLGFRMCNNVRNNPNSNMAAKVFTSVYCLFVAAFMFQVNQIGGAILASNVDLLVAMGAASGDRMAAYVDAPLIVGGGIQTLFVLFILVFQLAIVWNKD